MDQAVKPSPAEPAPAKDPVRLAIRLALLAGVIYWSYILILPFIPILVWSAILAVALYPVFDLLARLLGGRPVVSAILITILGLVIVIGPASWLAFGLIEGVRLISDQLGTGKVYVPTPNAAVKQWPLIGETLFDLWQLASTNLAAALGKLSPYAKPVATTVLATVGSGGLEILKFLVAVIATGFLFIPGPRLVSNIRIFVAHIVPERSEEFVKLTGDTIRSVSRGVIGIAILQAFLAGIGFIVADIPGAGLFAFLILLLGVAQIGCAIVLIPMIAWYWMTREPTAALLFTLYIVPVGFVDNALKPFVMGHGSRTPMVVILIGVLGGTLAHGLIGLFIGPIVLAVGWELLAAWMRDEAGRSVFVDEKAAIEADQTLASSARPRTLLP
ncbi:AI-2E family transporter [Bradyrhizobium sp. Tv2a-2]|uniref:AI-2E family transporter n=1 Tax=Bradyrhizobium sp. Tv2a-2 TaxID=113395 RepID=UPI000463250F|nr:AI-2E family transporter [Bradyrhizobium sp. Tv2a-2]